MARRFSVRLSVLPERRTTPLLTEATLTSFILMSAFRDASTRSLTSESLAATASSTLPGTTCSRLFTLFTPLTLRTVCSALVRSSVVATFPCIVTSPLIVSTLAPLTLKPSVVRRAIFAFVVIQESLTSALAATAPATTIVPTRATVSAILFIESTSASLFATSGCRCARTSRLLAIGLRLSRPERRRRIDSSATSVPLDA
jgi:hypothetical protein